MIISYVKKKEYMLFNQCQLPKLSSKFFETIDLQRTLSLLTVSDGTYKYLIIKNIKFKLVNLHSQLENS